jgi:Flp pilus assembly protein TadG
MRRMLAWRPFPRTRPAELAEDEHGLVLVFFAISFLGLFAFLAIVAESGLVFLERRELQNTADAAALAGAQQLFVDPSGAEFVAEDYAAASTPALVTNDAVVVGTRVSQTVSRNAKSLFTPGSVLSFGEPEVTAQATARLAAARLPGPGVSCFGVSLSTHIQTQTDLAGQDVLAFAWADLDPVTTILRFGGGAGSNAGLIDIEGDVNQNTRDCLREGSANALEPVEETQTGISTGQVAQALQARLEAARARTDVAGGGCFSWDEIVNSIRAADADGDGIADDGSWRCHPLANQDTAVLLVPVFNEDFQDVAGTTPINLHDLGDPQPYLLTLVFVDAERTFVNTSAAHWQYRTQGAGQAEVIGVWLLDAPTTLHPVPLDGTGGGLVDCDQSTFLFCFTQLVD